MRAIQADVSDPAAVRRLHDEAVDTFGPVEILVNNAGASKRGSLPELTDDDWREDLELKLFGAIRLSRLVVPGMIEGGGGRIVNIVAISGKHPGAASGPSSVSRAAGIAFTKALSKELAPHEYSSTRSASGSSSRGSTTAAGGMPPRTCPARTTTPMWSDRVRSRSVARGRRRRSQR